MSFEKLVAGERRRDILRILAEQPDYPINGQVMQRALASFGYRNSLDVIRADFAWLDEQGLVRLERLTEEIYAATVTKRGVDVAKGYAQVPGVAPPDGG